MPRADLELAAAVVRASSDDAATRAAGASDLVALVRQRPELRSILPVLRAFDRLAHEAPRDNGYDADDDWSEPSPRRRTRRRSRPLTEGAVYFATAYAPCTPREKKALRQRLGGPSQQVVHAWCRGSIPSVRWLARIADVVGIPVETWSRPLRS
jgi:hypothetical protein